MMVTEYQYKKEFLIMGSTFQVTNLSFKKTTSWTSQIQLPVEAGKSLN